MSTTALRRAAACALLAAGLSFCSALTPGSAQAVGQCTPRPYSYAGLIGSRATAGVRATITVAAAPRVSNGHVAAWIGVGGPGRGAGGQDAWIQIGINAFPGTGNKIYAEAWIPGHGQAYKELGAVPVGGKVNASVVELAGRPGWWQAQIDGRPVTKPVYLAGSHRAWEPMLLSESWNAGTPTCNDFRYRFGDVRVFDVGGLWKPLGNATALTDEGYRLSGRNRVGFQAGSY